MWSSVNDKVDKDGGNEMFGVSKVIFGDSGINDVIIDMDGALGMTQHAMGIRVKSKSEAKHLKHALESDGFKRVLSALSFSNFQIDWRMFKYFKPDFYKYFLKDTKPSPVQEAKDTPEDTSEESPVQEAKDTPEDTSEESPVQEAKDTPEDTSEESSEPAPEPKKKTIKKKDRAKGSSRRKTTRRKRRGGRNLRRSRRTLSKKRE